MKSRRARFARALLVALVVSVAVMSAAALFALPRNGFAWIEVVYRSATLLCPAVLAAAACVIWKRTRARLVPAVFVALASSGFALRCWATYYEPRQLVVRRIEIISDEVGRPLRIVHVSDVQSDRISEWEAEVFRTIAALEPDLVIHTGDLVQPRKREQYAIEYGKLAPLFASVPASLGRYNVPGDNDWPIRELLRERGAPMRTLMNEAVEIELGGGYRIRMLGLDVRTARRPNDARARIDRFIAADSGAFNVVFAHAPDFVLVAKDYDVDLSLAGHTHGGQIRLPIYGPPVTLTRAPRRLARGFHRFGRTHINTSAGVGAEHSGGLPSIRINCPPEITLITVHAAPTL